MTSKHEPSELTAPVFTDLLPDEEAPLPQIGPEDDPKTEEDRAFWSEMGWPLQANITPTPSGF